MGMFLGISVLGGMVPVYNFQAALCLSVFLLQDLDNRLGPHAVLHLDPITKKRRRCSDELQASRIGFGSLCGCLLGFPRSSKTCVCSRMYRCIVIYAML